MRCWEMMQVGGRKKLANRLGVGVKRVMNRRTVFLVLVGLFLIWGLWKGVGVFGRSYERQILDAQEELLRAVERRDWNGVQALLKEDYTDEGGHDRETAVADGRQALAHFYTLTLKSEVTSVAAAREVGEVQMILRLEGTGAGLSQFVLSKVNGMPEPWIFHWQKVGRWPWDWKVSRIHHDRLASLPRPDR